MCIGMLADLNAKQLCETGCARKMFGYFDKLFAYAPLFGESKPSDMLSSHLCSFVKDPTGGKHYCADLLSDVEDARDADAMLSAAPRLCLVDARGKRPCLEGAKAIVGRFGKGTSHGAAAAETLCNTAAAISGGKVRTSIETPLTTTGELTAAEERDLCDRVAEDVRDRISDNLEIAGADVTVIVTIRRSSSGDAVDDSSPTTKTRRLSASAYVLSTDIVSSSGAMPPTSELFDSCVKPAVDEAAGQTTSTMSSAKTTEVPAASFVFDEGEDISSESESGSGNNDDGEGGADSEDKKDDNFLFGYSKRTVFLAGTAAAATIVLAAIAAFFVRRRKRNRLRRRSFRLPAEAVNISPAVAVPIGKIDLDSQV